MQNCNVHISWKSCSHDLLFTENLILIVRTLYFLKRRSSGLDLKTSWSFMWQGGDEKNHKFNMHSLGERFSE